MLVHICCSVDSFYYLSRLKEKYPHEKLIGFFDNPNIHPYSEYLLRRVDAKRSCEYFNIPFFEGEYNLEGWLDTVRGFEHEPEKGSRCVICFDDRLEATCQKAVELGESTFTTTLLMSPQKDHEQLKAVGRFLKNRYDVEFVFDDFRSSGGTQAQNKMSREMRAYHQDYCGCMFALEEQRFKQGKIVHEMFSPIGNQFLFGSIEERLLLYEKRFELEQQQKSYTIIQKKFLNYRLLRGWVKWEGNVQKSYILSYSTLAHKQIKAEVVAHDEHRAEMIKGDVTFLSFEFFKKLASRDWETFDEMLKHPLDMEQEVVIRGILGKSSFDLGAIIVVQKIPEGQKVEVCIQSSVFEDTKENLIVDS